jgi:hypothetical protein
VDCGGNCGEKEGDFRKFQLTAKHANPVIGRVVVVVGRCEVVVDVLAAGSR